MPGGEMTRVLEGRGVEPPESLKLFAWQITGAVV